ncbi:MAG: hypothetical protein Q8Q73_10360 [Stagnimonas sp.]|nr:hypothetical protein [Stagnimonas sp.]
MNSHCAWAINSEPGQASARRPALPDRADFADVFGYGALGALFWYPQNPSPTSPYDAYGLNLGRSSSLTALQ